MEGSKTIWSCFFKFVGLFPCETKHIENYSRMSPGDCTFIPRPENRSMHSAVRKVYYVAFILKIRITVWKLVLQINIVQADKRNSELEIEEYCGNFGRQVCQLSVCNCVLSCILSTGWFNIRNLISLVFIFTY